MIGPEDDRITVRRHLHRPRHDAVGVERSGVRRRPQRDRVRRTKTDPDPIGLGLHDEDGVGQLRQHGGIEPVGVRARDDAQLDR